VNLPPSPRGEILSLRGGRSVLAASLLIVLPACQTIGRTPPPTVILSPPSVEVQAMAEVRDIPDLPPPPVPPVPVRAPDPILHSIVLENPSFRSQVERWIGTWRDRQTGSFQIYMERMRTLSSIVEEEIIRRDLPPSLGALPIVESGYVLAIANPSGAGGLWQIMPATARNLGLEVSTAVDERRDPVASTRAALGYLERHYEEFGSWFLAIAAYNAGSGTIGNLIARAGGRREGESGDELFLRIRSSFPAETEDLLARFIAAATLSADLEGYGMPLPESAPWNFDEVELSDAVSLDVIARAAGVLVRDIQELNPQILRGYLSGGTPRTVRIPAGSRERFLEAYALVPPSDRLAFVEHVVASGETLSHIAQRYGVPLAEVLSANDGVDPRRLRIGMRIRIPSGR